MSQDYYELSMRTLQLAGMNERTQESYTRAVRMLVEFCGKFPDQCRTSCRFATLG